MQAPPPTFIAAALIPWHAVHGRHDLPWQKDRTPYRVWVSEIMLQQTQVATVIPYYERFLGRFPEVISLADAPLDDVLHLWSGLGYYSRARHLHRAAVVVRERHGGHFPTTFEAVAALPGIGRSTAGAILALSLKAHHPILDGNVRRVLSRFFGIDRLTTEAALMDTLWGQAEACTPHTQVDIYTQAIMDLGATICTRARPLCAFCPLSDQCVARGTGRQQELPPARVRRARGRREVFMPLARAPDGSVLLERRPESGVWGGLWAPPALDTEEEARAFLEGPLARAPGTARRLPVVTHAFTHFELVITPLLADSTGAAFLMEAPGALWYNPQRPALIGLPAPIKTLLESLGDRDSGARAGESPGAMKRRRRQ